MDTSALMSQRTGKSRVPCVSQNFGVARQGWQTHVCLGDGRSALAVHTELRRFKLPSARCNTSSVRRRDMYNNALICACAFGCTLA
jgi:hypothetical protein